MRVIVLSNHGGVQLQRTQRNLAEAGMDLDARNGAYRAAWADLRQAKQAKPLWKRLLTVSTAAERQAGARVRGTWREVLRAVAEQATPLPAENRERIVGLIRRDHEFHERRGRRPR